MAKPIVYILCEVSKRSFLSYVKYSYLFSQFGFDVCIIHSYLFHLIISNQPGTLLPGIVVDKDFSHRAWSMRHQYLNDPWIISGFVEEAIMFSNPFVFEFLSDVRSLNRADYIFSSTPNELNVVRDGLKTFGVDSNNLKLFTDPRATICSDFKINSLKNGSSYIDIFGDYSLILGSYSKYENPNDISCRDKHFDDVKTWYEGSTRDSIYVNTVLDFHQSYREAHWRMFQKFNNEIIELANTNQHHKFVFRPHPGFTMRNGISEFGNLLQGRFNFEIFTSGSFEPLAASATNIFSTVSTSHYLLCQAGYCNSYVGGNVSSEPFIHQNTWNNYEDNRLINDNFTLQSENQNCISNLSPSFPESNAQILKELYDSSPKWDKSNLAANVGFLAALPEIPSSTKFEAFSLTDQAYNNLYSIFSAGRDIVSFPKLIALNKDVIYIKS